MGKAIWIEIDKETVKDNLIFGQDLIAKWKQQEAYRHTIMPIIEIAHVGALPTTAFRTVLAYSKSESLFKEHNYTI